MIERLLMTIIFAIGGAMTYSLIVMIIVLIMMVKGN